MAKVLAQQEARLKRKEDIDAMNLITKKTLKGIKQVQGNRYAHQVLEDKYQTDVVLPEIAR